MFAVGLLGILERQGARCDHEPGADQGDAGSVDAQAGNPAERKREIASGKDDAGCNAPTLAPYRKLKTADRDRESADTLCR